jgi:hypothetical protein
MHGDARSLSVVAMQKVGAKAARQIVDPGEQEFDFLSGTMIARAGPDLPCSAGHN